MISRIIKALSPMLGTLFLLLASYLSFSQTFLSQNYTTSNGMGNPKINSITQDKKGKMWFATGKGISCYDGARWFNYSFMDGLRDTEYSIVKPDNHGNIRALTNKLNDGIFCFDGTRWTRLPGPENIPVTDMIYITSAAIIDDGQNTRIGIGTDHGFYLYETGKNRWTHPLYYYIWSIDVYNNTFLIASGNGLFKWDTIHTGNPTPLNIDIPSSPVYSISVNPFPGEPRIWMIGKEWAGYYIPPGNSFHLHYRGAFPGFTDYHPDSQMTSLADNSGGLWVGNMYALLNIDRNGYLQYYGKQNSFIGEGVCGLFYDRENNLWVGNYRGVTKIASFRFENYNKNNGLFDNEVTAICEMKNGAMVFGHNGGFSFLDGKTIRTYKIPLADQSVLIDSRVLDICRDDRGNVWASVQAVGILKISPDLKMKWYKNPIQDKKQNYYSSILTGNPGEILAGMNNRVLKFDNNTDRFVPIKTDTEITTYIRRIFADKRKKNDNSIYIATIKGGFYRLNGNHLTQVVPDEENTSNSIYAVYPYKEEDLLIGTYEGLFLLKEGAFRKFEDQRLEINNPVYFITRDREENLWFGLNNGVIRWDEQRNPRLYSKRDGLAGNETNRAAGFLDSKGRMWIGTDSGVSCYNRSKDITSSIPPLTELLYMEASGSRYPLNRDISLKASQNDLTFHFQAISFIDETAVKYNLKLEGFDQNWTSDFQSSTHQIRYTNIPPGNYRFYIQAVNGMGIESDIKSSGSISIEKTASHPWWLYFIGFFITVTFILLTINFFSRKGYAARLENQYRQRTQQLEASERELRNIFNTAHDAILIFAPDDEVVLDVNKRACDIYGFSRPEFIGMSLETITKNVRLGKTKITETLKKGDYINFETTQYRKDGSEMILEINASVIDFRGKPAILSLNRDITRRKHVEQRIEQSLVEKEILLKEVHHRVKNNLQVILSLLDLQADKLENPEVISVFQDSKNRIRSMALVHENLYQSDDLARIDSEEYIQSVVDYFLSTYGNLGDRITYKIMIENIMLDMDTAIPLGLILTELLSNALKHAFLPGKKGKLTISFKSESRGMLTLSVRDNGVGLPGDEKLQESKSLGLQLVTLLTKQVKGDLQVIRRGGATFKVTFPYVVRAENTQDTLEKKQ